MSHPRVKLTEKVDKVPHFALVHYIEKKHKEPLSEPERDHLSEALAEEDCFTQNAYFLFLLSLVPRNAKALRRGERG